MKCITLWEPYATLMVVGAKAIETRPRNFTYRGIVGIHSGLKKTKEFADLCKTYPFNLYIDDYDALPFGKISGQVEVIASTKITNEVPQLKFIIDGKRHDVEINPGIEIKFGNYAPGRTAILTRNPIKWLVPIKASGLQAMPWELPDFMITEKQR